MIFVWSSIVVIAINFTDWFDIPSLWTPLVYILIFIFIVIPCYFCDAEVRENFDLQERAERVARRTRQ